ncbi:MAG: anthranilate phosphoribosyltransferase [Pseudomonadota bacterium]
MDMQAAIRAVTENIDLAWDEMTSVMETIMTGEATPSQIGGFLIGLRMKGETVGEIAAAAHVMRALATKVRVTGAPIVDTCGTGGDEGPPTFNISTTAALVAAAAGARVAKHGNRSVSSRSGSADVLEAAGVSLSLAPEAVSQCVDEAGVGFMFAPNHHGAMRHAIGPRREMGARTLFNLLGPLTNPADAPNQLIGVFSPEWVGPVAAVLAELGSRHVIVCHSEDKLDEISIGAPTFIAEMRDGKIREYRIAPEDFGFERSDLNHIAVDDVPSALAMMQGVLDNQPGPARDIVCMNAGAAIFVAGLSESLAAGVKRASELIAEGKPRAVLSKLCTVSARLAQTA